MRPTPLFVAASLLLLWACSKDSPSQAPPASGLQPDTAGSSGQGAAGEAPGGASGSGTSAGVGGTMVGSGGTGAAGESVGGGGAGGEEVPPGCEIPAQQGEFYALSAESLEQLDPIPMCTYRGKVVMIVNVASKCGYTPQYAPLQKLYDTYREKGFVVLGFPCAQFAGQEFQDDKDIAQFCTETYGITFPMFTRIDVNGPNEHPIYTWLKAQPGGAGDIPWNFTKFLLGRDGKLLKRIPTDTSPDAPHVVKLIEEALAAAP
ncbi:MAG: glutathione peroxidase [Myxococcales bacterium]|nr:glutathione peroxidase [Polyangiaceae bacterium]MDW8250661.1 glutathione peroxidase [Myxococcales bacterium]